ncbi:OVARIAN TUMOR DOMAIN-containing deubiquitinating enzyme 6 [Syzygium oleosum]|uniref:OVARIAN TUMOR DOMAIN-containing deubiquitinating enzyme 6 n=1 Tax=Syzygium oleosum TaxID=219896 RepID=UPI0011D1A4A1|nr:OVARIAN TUMOR DOMAIN-containing deubiquitinating enzyme 6 [Syzygium oleosum]XP_056165161.1 OVARIAN TUMOR DOMAIN-containing deubiquitinating enzyme 6 [Syzygium oleosum]XP_056165162.1 OVARIAN TUMOR DOMAIN-containing deubiquitinating enzyme 6 [Syzygium oleosum]
MTRILVQRGSGGSSSNPSRSSSSARTEPQPSATASVVSAAKDEESEEEVSEQVVVDELSEYYCGGDSTAVKSDEHVEGYHADQDENLGNETHDGELLVSDDPPSSEEVSKGLGGLKPVDLKENEGTSNLQGAVGSLHPPPPPAPPRPFVANSNLRRAPQGSSNPARLGPSRRSVAWPVVSARTSPTGSRPSSPRSHCESEGYNSADEQGPCFVSYDDLERERQFEIEIGRIKGLEVKRMLEDGNCLFRAVADQVYGDSDEHGLVRQMCIDYMEHERDHFSQFVTENFTQYCRRKRRDKVYGNNVEIQAFCEIYNRPIHIYSYSTEPINIFQGSYNTDTPPIRLSYHHGNHYNSLVDPRRLAIGAGLGFGSFRGTNVDKDQVKAAIKAQQDQQIDNALLAEGRFWSDLELTEKEIERMVMEASRAEYLASDKLRKQPGIRDSSTSSAEPSSSGGTPSGSEMRMGSGREHGSQHNVLSSSMQVVLSMGFTYLQAIDAYSIFGDDVDSMVCYLLETSSSRRKGKATE